jgi:hypothetical protein
VAFFKAFELVVDVLCQTIGHGLATRDYFSIGHDLPQIVFDRLVHVAIVLAWATVRSGCADRHFIANRVDVTAGFGSALVTLRSCCAMLGVGHIGSTTRLRWGMFGCVASAVRRLGVQEVCGHTNLS